MAPSIDVSEHDHREIAAWAFACAERVIPIWRESVPHDDRPVEALAALRRWIAGDLSVGDARTAAFAAHAAAREASTEAARLAARACGQAASVPHMNGHAPHAASYARKAIAATGGDADAELAWQREIATPAVRTFLAAQLKKA